MPMSQSGLTCGGGIWHVSEVLSLIEQQVSTPPPLLTPELRSVQRLDKEGEEEGEGEGEGKGKGEGEGNDWENCDKF